MKIIRYIIVDNVRLYRKKKTKHKQSLQNGQSCHWALQNELRVAKEQWH